MQRASALTVALGLIFAAGCGPSAASDAKIKQAFLDGVSEIQEPRTTKELHDQLVQILASLRSTRSSTPAGRRAKALAGRGFEWMLRGTDARLEIARNDSGSLEASVEDAKRSDRAMRRGANLLRAAGRTFGVRIGNVNGF
jgi:hypothetical protein